MKHLLAAIISSPLKGRFGGGLLALLATTSLWAYDFQSGDLYYNIPNSSVPYVEVTYQNWRSNNNYSGLTTATIPETVIYNGITYNVISIGANAFYGCSSLTSVTIPNSVTSIDSYAFCYCRSLTSVTIPNSVTLIGSEVFLGCSSLSFPVYNAHCFAYMPTSYAGAYTIPESIKQIVGGAFYGCSSLTSVTIPNSVTSIGSNAFEGCSSLTSITIPNSVISVGIAVFSGCNTLTSIVVEEGNTTYDSRDNCNAIIETATNTLIAGCKNTIISNSVTSIGDYAFADCSSLTSITIPNSITSIGYSAFSSCRSLTSLTIPNSVTSIGDYAFYNCSSLTSIAIPNSVTSIGNYAFEGTHIYLDDSNWDKDVLYIDDCLIKAKTSLSGTYTIKKNTRLIADYAFDGCKSLTSVTIGNSVTKIGERAFSGCSSLTSLTIPNSVTSIGDYAFYNCSSLTSIAIPNSVTSIGNYAFEGTHIYLDDSNWDKDVLYIDDCLIKAKTSLSGTYTIKKNTRLIADYAFLNCTSLTSVTIPNSVTNIGYGVFAACSSLSSITIPNSVTSIGSFAFASCTSLTSIAIPNSVTSIGEWAFRFCTSITSITIPNSVKSIGAYAFSYCDALISVTIPNSVRNIEGGTFGSCSSLTSITIPSSINSIGSYAFANCTSLTSLTIPNSVTSIGLGAFHSCESLDTVICLAMTPPALGEDVFYGCDNPTLFVPCAALSDYQLHEQWGQFTTIECISSEEVETEDVVVESGTTTIIITWPTDEKADTYTIVIMKDGEVVCTLSFNSQGQLLNIAFAPGRDGNHPAQYAEHVAGGKGFRFTVTGLEDGTDYTYDITVKNEKGKVIKKHSGKFTTLPLSAVENILSPASNTQKLLRDGQLIILRDGVEYNAMGQEM